MTTQNPSTSDTHSPEDHSRLTNHALRRLGAALLVLSLVAVEPVAAASQTGVCSASNLPGMIEGFFQLTTALGIIGLAVVWQANSLIDMFTLNTDQKRGLKRHKRSALKSAVVLVVLGPLYTVAGSMMGLPLAHCVNLTPW